MVEAIAQLAIAYQKLGYYPQQFKEAYTIILQKLDKPKYSNLGAWRPIALLSTIGKVIETLIAKRIGKVVEENHLLLDTQMGARVGRSIEIALELLTKQIYIIQRLKWHIVILLLVDILGAFNIVNPIRLLDILRKKQLLYQLIQQVQAFITIVEKSTTPSRTI